MYNIEGSFTALCDYLVKIYRYLTKFLFKTVN